MAAVTLVCPSSSDADGAHADETPEPSTSDDGCVPTREVRVPEWPQADFVAWMDAVKGRRHLKSDYQLAQHWGIGHTLISGWRSNKQRPSFETLTKVAAVERIDARTLWVLAGLVTAGDVGLLDEDLPPQSVELPPAVVELLDLLNDASLDAAAREQLLSTVRVLVAGTRAHLPSESPRQGGSSRSPGRKAG